MNSLLQIMEHDGHIALHAIFTLVEGTAIVQDPSRGSGNAKIAHSAGRTAKLWVYAQP